MLDPFWRAASPPLWSRSPATPATPGARAGPAARSTSSAVSGLINVAVALAIGLFVDRLLRESDRRATLVDALTAAQRELAEAQHLAGVHDGTRAARP